jgi:hypothetical protein
METHKLFRDRRVRRPISLAIQSQPSLRSRQPRCLNAVRRAQLADCLRKIITHGSLGKMEFLRNLIAGMPLTRTPKNLPFPLAEEIGAGIPRLRGQVGIDHAHTLVHAAHSLSGFGGRAILEQIALRFRVERPAQVTGPRIRRQYYDSRLRKLLWTSPARVSPVRRLPREC